MLGLSVLSFSASARADDDRDRGEHHRHGHYRHRHHDGLWYTHDEVVVERPPSVQVNL